MEKPFTAYKGDEPYIFVCYAHEDSAIVYPEIKWLHQQGVKIWYDEGISAGRIWRKEIAEAIQGASKFLYYVSKAALASDHCNREVDYALDKAFDVVPVFLEETQLTPELDLALNRVQALHRKNDTSYQQHLLDAVGGATAVEPEAVVSKKKITIPIFAGLAVLVTVIATLSWFGFNFVDTGTESPIDSIAVLPLENLSGDPGQDYFSDGTTEMLIQELGKISSLRVTSRQSIVQYKKSEKSAREIAEELGVDGLLTGSVIQTLDRIRVNVQLYDVQSDSNIWAERYERDLTDILTLQSDIARAVSQQINIELTGGELAALSTSREVDPESHRAYLLGRYHVSRGSLGPAGEAFKRAIDLDPTNADALAELSRVTIIEIWDGGSHQDLLPLAREYNERALALVPNHPHAQATEALLLFFEDREYQQAIDRFAELLTIYPNDLYVLLYYSFAFEITDHLERALQLYNRILELDPLNAAQTMDRGYVYLRMGEYGEALASYEQAESLGLSGPTWLAELAFYRDDKEGLAFQLQRDTKEWVGSSVWQPLFRAYLAMLDGDMQRVQDLVEAYDNEEGVASWWYQSYYPRLLGDSERAVKYYSRALDNNEPQALMKVLGGVGAHEMFPEFYNHPGYAEMLRANGLDPASIANLNLPPFPF